MWTFLMMLVLLDLSQATAVRPERTCVYARVTGRPSSPQVFPHLDQTDASTVTPALDMPQQMTSSSSSSSSSESSQSSEGFEPQQQLEPQNTENTALEQSDSEESAELLPPPRLRHHQLVSPGVGGDTEGGGAQKSHRESTEVGGANTNVAVEKELVGGAEAEDEGVASKEKLLDDSSEQEDHLHLHDDHSEEAGLELAL